MTFPSKVPPKRKGTHVGDYGFARVRDLAFDAVMDLWKRRSAEGMKKSDLAIRLNRDRGWVSTNLRGPGNWTLRTFGELVNALDGEAEIHVHALEDQVPTKINSDAYSGYLPDDHSYARNMACHVIAKNEILTSATIEMLPGFSNGIEQQAYPISTTIELELVS